jgi:RibD domain-containing protein
MGLAAETTTTPQRPLPARSWWPDRRQESRRDQAGLLDELMLFVHPVVAGAGRHLFEDGGGQVPLTLLESRAHHNGVVALRYSGRGL